MKQISVVPYRIGGISTIRKMYRKYVLKRGYEGLVVHEQRGVRSRVTKLKTQFTVDAAVIGISKEGKTYKRGMFGALLLALRDKKGRLIELSRMSGMSHAEKIKWRKRLEKNKFKEDDKYVYVRPEYVFEVKFLETMTSAVSRARMRVFKLKRSRRFKHVAWVRGYTLRSPSFVRWRPDKTPSSINDVRLSQIAEYVGSTMRRRALEKNTVGWVAIRSLEDIPKIG